MGSQSHDTGKLHRVEEAFTSPETDISYKAGSYRIAASSLGIIWGNDPRYWRIPPEGNEGPVELLQVCWLEIKSLIDCKKLDVGKYKISFVVSLKPGASGWAGNPVDLMARAGKSPFKWVSVDLSRVPDSKKCFQIPDELLFEVTRDNIDKDEKLTFGLFEILSDSWKRGLVIHEVIISPLQ